MKESDRAFTVRLDVHDLYLLKLIAALNDLTVTQYIRDTLERQIKLYGPRAEKVAARFDEIENGVSPEFQEQLDKLILNS
jgi:hypothetical protein